MASKSGQRTIQSIAKGCEILDHLRENGPTTITEIASNFELSAGTIHTYLATFKQYGFVEQDGSEYDLGPMFIPFGVRTRNRSPIYTASKTIIQRLAYDTGGCVRNCIDKAAERLDEPTEGFLVNLVIQYIPGVDHRINTLFDRNLSHPVECVGAGYITDPRDCLTTFRFHSPFVSEVGVTHEQQRHRIQRKLTHYRTIHQL